MTTTALSANGGCCPQQMGLGLENGKSFPPLYRGDTRSRPKEYRLPHDVAERLRVDLAAYRNAQAAMALAVFLARFWSSRSRLARPFPVDRRALADHVELGLSESRIRGALRVLEEIGFLNRGLPPAGSVHRVVATGELHRKPITFGFGPEYGPRFAAANARAERARARREGRAVQGNPVVGARRPSQAPRASESWSPKNKTTSEQRLIMGELAKGSSEEPSVGQPVPSSALERAIGRLLAARGEADIS